MNYFLPEKSDLLEEAWPLGKGETRLRGRCSPIVEVKMGINVLWKEWEET